MIAEEILTREEAISRGLKKYFLGKPCKNGHLAFRLVCDWKCVECQRIKRSQQYWDNPAAMRAKAASWRRANIEGVRAYCRQYDADHREERRIKALDRMRRRYKDDPEGCREYKSNYRRDTINGWISTTLSNCKKRAREINKEFALTKDDFLGPLPTHCEDLGIRLVYGNKGKSSPNSASIDRIDSSSGYVSGNIRIISFRANILKSDARDEELIRIGRSAARRRKTVNSRAVAAPQMDMFQSKLELTR